MFQFIEILSLGNTLGCVLSKSNISLDCSIGTIKITVKKNADAITVTGIEEGAEYTVGDEVLVSLPAYVDGVKQDTDVRAIAESDYYTVVDNGNRTFTVKFTKAGDVAIKAYAFQSAKYTAETAAKTINVKVVDKAVSVVGVKQLTPSKFQIEFSGKVEYTKDSFASEDLYYLTSIGVKIPLGTSLKAVTCKDNVATFEMWQTLTENRTYYVELPEFDAPASFKVNSYAPADFEVESNNEVKEATTTNLKIKWFNVDGVEVAAGTAYVTPTIKAGDSNDCNISDSTVWFSEAGKSVQVEFSFDTGKIVETTEGVYDSVKITHTATFASVKDVPVTYTDEYLYGTAEAPTLSDSDKKCDNIAKFSKELTIYIGENVDSSAIKVLRKTGEKYYNDTAKVSAVEANGNIKFSVDNAEVAVVDNNQKIIGITADKTATILVKKYVVPENGNPSWQIIDAIKLIVKPAKVATSVTIAAENNKRFLNISNTYADSISIKVTVKDNYGNDMTADAQQIKWVQDTKADIVGTLVIPQLAGETITCEAKKFKITNVTSPATDNNGNVASKNVAGHVEMTVNGKAIKSNQIFVTYDSKTANDATVAIDNAALDTGLVLFDTDAKKNNVKTATVKINLTNGNYVCGTADAARITKKPVDNATCGTMGWASITEGYYYILSLDGKVVTAATNANIDFDAAGNVIAFTNLVTGNKLGKGQYTVDVYKIVKKGATGTDAVTMKVTPVKGAKNIVVTDNDAKFTFEKVADKIDGSVKVDNVEVRSLKQCFVAKYNGTKLTIADVDDNDKYQTNDGRWFVKTIRGTANFFGYGDKAWSIDVKTLIDGNGSNN